jgi:hypothetical protein
VKTDALKDVTRKSPQHKDELNVGVIMQAENKITAQECKYSSYSAGNSVNKHGEYGNP